MIKATWNEYKKGQIFYSGRKPYINTDKQRLRSLKEQDLSTKEAKRMLGL